MRTRLIVLLMSLSAVLLSGCSSASDPFVDSELCKYYRVNSGEIADGQSAPYPITVEKGQRVSLSYMARIPEGSADFQLLTDLSEPTWQTSIKVGNTPTTLGIDSPLAEGQYNMIITFHDAKGYKICWKVDVE
jgi:hypothetical protein